MNRDQGIKTIFSRDNHSCYGMGLGIIILDDVYPGFPGDLRNASAYPFPIQYEIAEGVDIEALVGAKDKMPCLPPICQAARKLVRMGCKAITAECGYFSYFQKVVAGSVNVPVFMSSLLQVPMAQQVIGKDKVVGILVTQEGFMTDNHLRAVGIKIGSNYVVTGAEDQERCPEFTQLWTASLRSNPVEVNYAQAEREIVSVAVEFYLTHPRMGAMVLECTGMQPFARAIQREINIPVFSWGTMMDYIYSVIVHRDYYGHV